MNETETICKNCEYYYKEHCCSGDSVMCTYTVSEDFRCEWWEEKSRMKTWEMIKELTENPEKEFKLIGADDVVLKCDGDNHINLSGIDYLEPQTDRWEEKRMSKEKTNNKITNIAKIRCDRCGYQKELEISKANEDEVLINKVDAYSIDLKGQKLEEYSNLKYYICDDCWNDLLEFFDLEEEAKK